MKLIVNTVILVIGMFIGARLGTDKLTKAAETVIDKTQAGYVWVIEQWEEY